MMLQSDGTDYWANWGKVMGNEYWEETAFEVPEEKYLIGNFAVLGILAHEMGHHLGEIYGWEPKRGAGSEFFADEIAVRVMNELSRNKNLRKLKERYLEVVCISLHDSTSEEHIVRLEMDYDSLVQYCNTFPTAIHYWPTPKYVNFQIERQRILLQSDLSDLSTFFEEQKRTKPWPQEFFEEYKIIEFQPSLIYEPSRFLASGIHEDIIHLLERRVIEDTNYIAMIVEGEEHAVWKMKIPDIADSIGVTEDDMMLFISTSWVIRDPYKVRFAFNQPESNNFMVYEIDVSMGEPIITELGGTGKIPGMEDFMYQPILTPMMSFAGRKGHLLMQKNYARDSVYISFGEEGKDEWLIMGGFPYKNQISNWNAKDCEFHERVEFRHSQIPDRTLILFATGSQIWAFDLELCATYRIAGTIQGIPGQRKTVSWFSFSNQE